MKRPVVGNLAMTVVLSTNITSSHRVYTVTVVYSLKLIPDNKSEERGKKRAREGKIKRTRMRRDKKKESLPVMVMRSPGPPRSGDTDVTIGHVLSTAAPVHNVAV